MSHSFSPVLPETANLRPSSDPLAAVKEVLTTTSPIPAPPSDSS
jgi:hypothetical protein